MNSSLINALNAGVGTSLNIPLEADRYMTRWVFYPLRNLYHRNLAHDDAKTANEREGMIPRMRITRLRNNRTWDNIQAVPEEARVATRNLNHPNASPNQAATVCPARTIAQSLGTLYAESGFVELPALLGRDDPETDLGETLTKRFFPTEPATAEEARGLVQAEMNRAQKEGGELAALITQVGRVLLQSIGQAERFAKSELDKKHAEMTKAANGNVACIGYYDSRDYLHLAWASVTPRDQAMDALATGHNDLVRSLPEILKGLRNDAPALDEEKLGRAIAIGLRELVGQMQPVSVPADKPLPPPPAKTK